MKKRQAVELHQAFLWTCETCGRDNFERAVTVEQDAMNDEERAEMESIIGKGFEGFCLMAPETVDCSHCGDVFDATDEL